MFKRMLHSSMQGLARASAEETPATQAGPPMPTSSELTRTDTRQNGSPMKLPPFEEIYLRSTFKPNTTTVDWNIIKVADMLNSEHLRGLSPAAKHSALMMALEAAGVAVEDMLQDAVQRQRVLNETEDLQARRLEETEREKLRENERVTAEMESVSAQYRARIAAAVEDLARERQQFHDWQESKEREQRRISEAASACVSGDSTASDASVSRLLERNSNLGRFRESA
jgi:hypothetical protein